MTQRRKTELRQAWAVFAVAAIAWHVWGVENYLHEVGHAIVIIAQGGTVHELAATRIVASGFRPLGLYAGTLMGVMVRGVLMLAFLAARRSVVIPAWLWGRMVTEWAGWALGNRLDATVMERHFGWRTLMTYEMLHWSMTLGMTVGATVLAIRLLVSWNRDDPRHIENPSLIHAGQRARM